MEGWFKWLVSIGSFCRHQWDTKRSQYCPMIFICWILCVLLVFRAVDHIIFHVEINPFRLIRATVLYLWFETHLQWWLQADGSASGCTDLRSPQTCVQHYTVTSATQHWQDLPKHGRVGRQTGRLCCLAQARLRDRRLSHVWWLPELIYQSPPFQTIKALWRCRRYHTLTSVLTNRRGRWEMATHLFMVWCPQSGQGLWPQRALVRIVKQAAEQHLRLK